MAGLDPAIHLVRRSVVKMDTRVKPAYDGLLLEKANAYSAATA
jgi:hypothetical protein